VRPILVGGFKGTVVDERTGNPEPMSFDFVPDFARDSDLPTYEGCSTPEPERWDRRSEKARIAAASPRLPHAD